MFSPINPDRAQAWLPTIAGRERPSEGLLVAIVVLVFLAIRIVEHLILW
jgi:hypothetical protein